MKKVKGKALSLVLSLALVISSFSAIPASAATKTLNGSLGGNDNDSLYLVNGGVLKYEEFGSYVSAKPTMTTPNHKDVSDVHIAAVSHKSGDRLVKWYDSGSDGKATDSIDTDTKDANIDLELRSSTVSGTEVLSLLYKGTYTDDDDNEYTVKATQDVTVRVYDENQTVIGEASDDTATNCAGELDSSFAQKTVAYEKDEIAQSKLDKDGDPKLTDSKDLVVLKAVPESADSNVVMWEALKTSSDDTYLSDDDSAASKGVYYVLKSNSDNVGLDTASDFNDYSYKTGAVIKQGTTAGGTTYTMAAVTKNDTTPGMSLTTDGKLTVTAPDTTTDVDHYVYAAGTSAPTDWSTATTITADAATDVKSDLTESTTLYVAAVKVDGETVVGDVASAAVTVATTVAIGEDDCPTVVQDPTAFGKFTVTPAVNGEKVDPKWTYKYKVNDGDEQAVAIDTETGKGTITLPAPTSGDDVVLAVTAYDKDGKAQGGTTATVSVQTTPVAGEDVNYVTAQVATNANTGNVTFTAEATKVAEDAADADPADIYSASDIKVKSSVDKKILVGNDAYQTLSKYSTSTYLYSSAVDSDSRDDAVKVTGYEVNFNNNAATVSVGDKANVTKISGTVKSITVDEASVGSIAVSNDGSKVVPSVIISDAKVGDVDFDGDGGTLEVNSTDATVGNVTDASKVSVTNGTVGDIDADEADISAEDEEGTVKVGDVTAPIINVDSDNSKVATGTLTATSDDTEITLSGDFVTVAAVDFDDYGAELKIDGFTGTVPAPENATEEGATISTNATEDKVTIDGDADINAIAIGDDSQMIFNGKLNVGSVDGSGTLVVGLGKMDISSDASGVTLKFSDPTINVGDTAFTAVTDTVDVDSMEPYGCTLSMTEGSKEDTFKIASTDFVGMTFNPSSARIANGYSQTFAASTYAPGTALPEGYSVQYTLDGDDDIFQMTNNDDGTVTVKVVGYDDTFAEENTATLRAEVVDTDGDVDDDYSAGELDLTALAVPDSTFKSDTGSTLSIGGGFTYQFAITSLDGNVPYFAVAGNSFKTTYVGNSGNTYYYKVTAVGKVGDAAGVYINHGATPSTVITITNPSDTAAVTVKAGGSYQFRVNGPSQPVFQVAGIGNIALTSKDGSNYYFKVNVPTNLAKGGHGVYNNGVLVAILTVA